MPRSSGMQASWLPIYETLPHHPKVRALAKALKCHRHEAIGLLIDLWCWCLRNAEDGDLSGMESSELSAVILQRTRTGRATLKQVLNETGWMDGDRLHDWDEYIGELLQIRTRKRANNRERQQRYRDGQRNALHNNQITPSTSSHNTEQQKEEGKKRVPAPANHPVPIADQPRPLDVNQRLMQSHAKMFSYMPETPGLPLERLVNWRLAFPHANLEAEWIKMSDWLDRNTSKRPKRSTVRFITTWLRKADGETAKADGAVNGQAKRQELDKLITHYREEKQRYEGLRVQYEANGDSDGEAIHRSLVDEYSRYIAGVEQQIGEGIDG